MVLEGRRPQTELQIHIEELKKITNLMKNFLTEKLQESLTTNIEQFLRTAYSFLSTHRTEPIYQDPADDNLLPISYDVSSSLLY